MTSDDSACSLAMPWRALAVFSRTSRSRSASSATCPSVDCRHSPRCWSTTCTLSVSLSKLPWIESITSVVLLSIEPHSHTLKSQHHKPVSAFATLSVAVSHSASLFSSSSAARSSTGLGVVVVVFASPSSSLPLLVFFFGGSEIVKSVIVVVDEMFFHFTTHQNTARRTLQEERL